MSSLLNTLRKNQKHIKESFEKSINTQEEIEQEVETIIKYAYTEHLRKSFVENPYYK